jgi:hypothetical protein
MQNTELPSLIGEIVNFANAKHASAGIFTRAKQDLLAKLAAAVPIVKFANFANSQPLQRTLFLPLQ